MLQKLLELFFIRYFGFDWRSFIEKSENILNNLNKYKERIDEKHKIYCTPKKEHKKQLILDQKIIEEYAQTLYGLYTLPIAFKVTNKENYMKTILFVLALVTAPPHVVLTRYPESEKDLELYTENSPLIKNLPIFLKAAKYSLLWLQKLITKK